MIRLTAFALAGLLLLVATSCQTAPSVTTATYALETSWTEANASTLVEPFAVAVDPRSGHVVISDVATQQILVLTHEGTFVRAFGGPGDGPGAFRRPTGLAVGPDGSIYVRDFELDRLQKFSNNGQLVRQWDGDDVPEGLFQGASGLAVDRSGRVYVADFANQRVHRLNDQGRLIDTLGQAGGPGAGQFHYPTDVAIAPDGTVVVADTYNHRLQTWRPGVTADEEGQWEVLPPQQDAAGSTLRMPTGVAVSPDGEWLHVADSANHRLVMLDRRGRLVAQWRLPHASQRYSPTMVAVSPDGRRVYATDPGHRRVLVLRVDVKTGSDRSIGSRRRGRY